MRILIVSQMYPGPGNPDLGIFVHDMRGALEARGHDVDVIAVTRRGGGVGKHLGFAWRAIAGIVRRRPDVVYAHFLAPAGLWAAIGALLARRPLVVTAHGRDVRNVGERRGVRAATGFVLRRARAVVAVSGYLRDILAREFPQQTGKLHVIDSGIDLARFAPADAHEARALVGWGHESPALLFVGSLDARKNVLRLADAFARLGRGSLAFVGDGALRDELAGRSGVTLVGRIPHEEVAAWIAACDVLCLPSTVEPFGQALLEAMACERSVVATNVGGPPEFVPPQAGVLVDPLDVASIGAGLEAAAQLPSPNPSARAAAAEHDIVRQAARVERVLRQATQA